MTPEEIAKLGEANRGFMHERVEHNPVEAAFAGLWERENDRERRANINFGYGTLQDLFMTSHPLMGRWLPEVHHTITTRDRMVAATVVQWLGSNCGMSFLQRALGEAGYDIIRKEDREY